VDFDLTPEQQELASIAEAFASKIAGGYVDRDRKGEFPRDLLHELGRAHLLGIDVPEEAGGEGAGNVAAGLVTHALGKADFLAAQLVMVASTGANLLHNFADPAIAAEWVPRIIGGQTTLALGLTEPEAGSDLAAIKFRAVPDGDDWLLSGEKCSVSFPQSDALVVLARTPDDDLALFFVPKSADIEVSPLHDMGNRNVGRSIMRFDEIRVPGRNRLGGAGTGFKTIARSLTAGRLLACAIAIGVARAAWDDMVAWTSQRSTFGARLVTRQGIAFPIVDHATAIEMAYLLTMKGLWLADQGRPFDVEASMAKSWVPRRMYDVCHDAVLMIGHVAYTSEHPAQLRLRDILASDIGEGTANVSRIVLSRRLLGVTPG
jgi:cyclohexanecarboxyl-CoA dehydrogenase